MSAFLKVYAAAVTGLVLIALFNLVIDPYGIHNLFRWEGVNTSKPAMQNHEKLVKAYLTTRLKPAAVALGTSRADFGIDPAHPSWGNDSPRFNMALAGGSTFVTRRFLEHLLTEGRLRKVVFGLDFFAFNTVRPIASDYTDSVLAVLDDGAPNPNHLWNILASSTLSISATEHSLETLQADQKASVQIIDPVSGLRRFSIGGRIIDTRDLFTRQKAHTPEQGAHKSFRAMEELYLRHVYLAGSRREYAFENPGTGNSSLQEFRRIVRLCREHGLEAHFFISPPHARQMEVIHAIGLWPMFEQWKRALVQIIGEEDLDNRIPLWDFSGYNSITTLDVPRDTRMREYLDSTHYTPFVGDMILTRMLANETSSQLPEDFGTRLNSANIEAILEQIRAQQSAYHRSHPEDVQEIKDLAEEFGFNPNFVVFTGGQQPHAARSYREQPPASQAPEFPEKH